MVAFTAALEAAQGGSRNGKHAIGRIRRECGRRDRLVGWGERSSRPPLGQYDPRLATHSRGENEAERQIEYGRHEPLGRPYEPP
jgi:hypothetical protein